MLTPQAESLAAAGFDVITVHRRGTGCSGRDAWPATPDAAADQHADDAAALIAALDLEHPTVIGVSSPAAWSRCGWPPATLTASAG